VRRKSTRNLRLKKAFREAIGRKVHVLREARGLTTTVLARQVGISQAQVSRLENGQQGFRSDMLLELALALGVAPVALLAAWKG